MDAVHRDDPLPHGEKSLYMDDAIRVDEQLFAPPEDEPHDQPDTGSADPDEPPERIEKVERKAASEYTDRL